MTDQVHKPHTDAPASCNTDAFNRKAEADQAYGHLLNCAYERPAKIIEVADKNVPLDAKAVAKAGDDLAKGVWSDETRKYFKHFYDLAASQHNATPESIADELNALRVAVDLEAKKKGSKNEANLFSLQPDEHLTTFWMVISGPGITNEQSAEGVKGGQGGPKAARVGDFVQMRKPLPKA
jgi:hypothetical protein